MSRKPHPQADLCMAQWDDKRFYFNAKDSDGIALNWTGVSEIIFKVARSVKSAALLSKTLTGSTITTTAGGVFYLDVTDAESGALPTGTLYWDCQITTTSGDKQTIGSGCFYNQDTLAGD